MKSLSVVPVEFSLKNPQVLGCFNSLSLHIIYKTLYVNVYCQFRHQFALHFCNILLKLNFNFDLFVLY